MLFRYIIILIVLIAGKLAAQTPVYLDSTADVEARVSDLLGRMTLDEKIGQMTQADHKAVNDLSDLQTYFLGSILSGGGSDPVAGNSAADWLALYNAFQEQALQTRLGIPLIYGIDAVHGHSNVSGAVIFPHNIGMGATGDSLLMQRVARITAEEIAATGINWTFAPCVAVPRDERWGRTYEGFGETPELVSALGAAAVQGLQDDTLAAATAIVACAKHYIGDGGTSGGVDQGNTEISEAELRAIHLPGYRAAIRAGVGTIMASYNSFNGQKLHGHKYLLTDVLKDELGFNGFIVSDWAAIDQLPGDYASDIETSINAGIDMVMVPNQYQNFINTFKSLVLQGKISQARIDDAVSRILRIKFMAGLFEHPLQDNALLPSVGSVEHRLVGREAVRKSQVLLRKNDGLLPIPKSGIRILVAGEHANDIGLQSGGWTIQWQGASGPITEGSTILDGLRKLAPGANIDFNADGNFNDYNADYAIVVIGEQPYAEGQGDDSDLALPSAQVQLVRKFKKMGIPVITLLISGRPLILNSVLHNSDVLVASWLPGTEADGIADILFGDYQPTGSLPMSWPQRLEDIPLNVGDADYHPLFPYGFGLHSFEDSQSASAPLLSSALLNEDGTAIELSFNKSMLINDQSSYNFSVTVNENPGPAVIGVSRADFDPAMLLLALDEAPGKEDVIKLTYSGGNLAAWDGGLVASFTDMNVINFKAFELHSIPGKIEAEDYSAMSGVQTETTADDGGGLNVGWIDDGDWLEYDCQVASSGHYRIDLRVASNSAGGTIEIITNGTTQVTANLPVTNGWQNWTTVSQELELEAGRLKLRLFAQQGGFNLNWFRLEQITAIEAASPVPENIRLYQNYPNPFNPETIIAYELGTSAEVDLAVFDLQGRKVAQLSRGMKGAGIHHISFKARNLASGIYVYKFVSGRTTMYKKMMLLK